MTNTFCIFLTAHQADRNESSLISGFVGLMVLGLVQKRLRTLFKSLLSITECAGKLFQRADLDFMHCNLLILCFCVCDLHNAYDARWCKLKMCHPCRLFVPFQWQRKWYFFLLWNTETKKSSNWSQTPENTRVELHNMHTADTDTHTNLFTSASYTK